MTVAYITHNACGTRASHAEMKDIGSFGFWDHESALDAVYLYLLDGYGDIHNVHGSETTTPAAAPPSSSSLERRVESVFADYGAATGTGTRRAKGIGGG